MTYHCDNRFVRELRRAIHDFEEASIRLLNGDVEVDETYFGASFENRRSDKRAKLRKAEKVKRGRGAKERLLRHRGVAHSHFLCYLKEMESQSS